MDELSFKEKLAIKMLKKNNILDNDTIIDGNQFITRISLFTLLNNPQLIENVILKSKEKDSLAYKILILLDRKASRFPELSLRWIQLRNQFLYKYILDDPEKVTLLPLGFTIMQNMFEGFINRKAVKGEITKEQIDIMFNSFFESESLSSKGDNRLLKTILALKKNNQEELALYAIEKLKIILENKIDNFRNLTEQEKEIVKKSVIINFSRYIRGGIGDSEFDIIIKRFISDDDYKCSVSVARTGTAEMVYLTINQMNNINIKNVKQIIDLAKQKFPNISLDEGIFYKMYLVIGKQRSMELIEGKYGEISYSRIESIFFSINIDDYQISQMNAEPYYDRYQKALINFLFASGVNDINANIKKILTGEIVSSDLSLIRLFNEWNLYYDILGGNVTLNDLVHLMDDLKIVLPPNEKEIGNTIKLAGVQYKDIIADTYQRMQKRTSSTIPKVKGIVNEYEYEILDLVDPFQMNVGYYTECCFTFGGVSENSLVHACTNNDSRIFVIKKDGKVVAQSWVWRNGNTLCFDNIEVYGVSEQSGSKFWEVYEKVSSEMLNISQRCESQDKKIQLVTIGKGLTDIALKGKNLTYKKTPLPKNNSLYTDAKTQVIVATSEDYKKPLEYDVESIYQDERKKVMIVDPQQSSTKLIEKINDHIDKINYSLDSENFKKCDSSKEYTFIVYGFDWFVGVTTDGSIVKKEYSFDERSKEEILNALQLISKKIKSGELNNNISDVMLDTMIKESSVYGKK